VDAALAQAPGRSDRGQITPPMGMHPVTPAPPAATAPPDTALARITGPAGAPGPVAIHVAPAEVALGEPVAVALDFPPGSDAPAATRLQTEAPWLAPTEVPAGALADLPAGDGPRVTLGLRVWRLGPWRLAWGEAGTTGPVRSVAGRLQAGAEPAPVRDPRALGGLPRWAPWALAALLLALAVAWARWRRRRADRARFWAPPPAPAWLETARALRELDGSVGHDRRFLDRLAAIVRRYLQGRYGLPAPGMAAGDLAAVARTAAWPADPLVDFARLLQDCDDARYRPQGLDAGLCRQAMARAVALVGATRTQATWAPPPADLAAEAAAAWRELESRYPEAASVPERSAC
jgi:hypothetical protein